MTSDPLPLLEAGALHARLAAAFPQMDLARTHVALLAEGRTVFAGAPVTDESACFPAGCLTKLLSGRLVGRAIGEGRIGLDAAIVEHLSGLGPRPTEAMKRITVRHLLEHTHGLDDSRTRIAPHRSDGFIDAPALCAELTTCPPLHRPGTLHSYSNAGGWLSAALLERAYGQPYSELLRESVLAPLGLPMRHVEVDPQYPDDPPICSSTGGTLALSAQDLVTFLCSAFSGTCITSPHAAPDCAVRTPGWSGSELGITLGWKCYGAGWYGHNSELQQAAVLARVNPARRIAIVIASGTHPPASIAASLFGAWLPDLVSTRTPRALDRARVASLDVGRYAGVYRTRALTVSVVAERSKLSMNAVRHTSAGAVPALSCSLLPAQDHIFYCMPADRRLFPLLQFVEADGDRFRYLWNGASLIPAGDYGLRPDTTE